MDIIFDLDNTVIDSSHRKVTLADGTLDLDHWIANNKPEKIMQDKLLPSVITLRRDHKAGHNIIICTARVLGQADYDFFLLNNIPFNVMLDRPQGCQMTDPELKEIQLRLYAHKQGNSWSRFCAGSVFYEDSRPVIRHLKKCGVNMVDAVLWNHKLRHIAKVA